MEVQFLTWGSPSFEHPWLGIKSAEGMGLISFRKSQETAWGSAGAGVMELEQQVLWFQGLRWP